MKFVIRSLRQTRDLSLKNQRGEEECKRCNCSGYPQDQKQPVFLQFSRSYALGYLEQEGQGECDLPNDAHSQHGFEDDDPEPPLFPEFLLLRGQFIKLPLLFLLLRHLILGWQFQQRPRCLDRVIDGFQPSGQVLDGVRADHGGRDGVRPPCHGQKLCCLLREEVAYEEEDVESQGFHDDN